MCAYTQAVAVAGISTTRAPGVPATAVVYDEYYYHDYRTRWDMRYLHHMMHVCMSQAQYIFSSGTQRTIFKPKLVVTWYKPGSMQY